MLFVKAVLNDEAGVQHRYENMKRDDTGWTRVFIKLWTHTPDWYTRDHDAVLLQLAMMHNLDTDEYVNELNGEKTSVFQAILRLKWGAHRAFREWCAHRENVCSRLRFLSHCVVQALLRCNPSIIDRRVVLEKRARDDADLVLFNHYRDVESILFLNPTMKEAHLTQVRDERKAEDRKKDSKFEGNHGVYWDPQRGRYRVKRASTRDPFITRSVYL